MFQLLNDSLKDLMMGLVEGNKLPLANPFFYVTGRWIMDDKPEKRMAENYVITNAVYIGDKEVVMGVDESNAMPYFCAFHTENGLFGSYTDCIVRDDYVEMVELFSDRIKDQCLKIRQEQAKVTVPGEKITVDMCLPLESDTDLLGKVVVIREKSLRPEYRTAESQIVLVTGGNGARGRTHGTSCFCTSLYDGESSRWQRYDIQGEIKPEYMPQWAEERLTEIQKQEMTPRNHEKDREAR